jgi:hypothetical protein
MESTSSAVVTHGLSNPEAPEESLDPVDQAFKLYVETQKHNLPFTAAEESRRFSICACAAQIAVESDPSLRGKNWHSYMGERVDDEAGTNLRSIPTLFWIRYGRGAFGSIQLKGKKLIGKELLSALLDPADARVWYQPPHDC